MWILPEVFLHSFQFLYNLFQIVQVSLEVLEFNALFLKFLVQTLDCRQRHPAFVHGGNVSLIDSNIEGGIEILRHRTYVA